MRLPLLNRLFLLCCCLAIAFDNYGQPYYNQLPQFLKANSVWGLSGGRVDFNTYPPTFSPNPTATSGEGIASAADPITGAYLFFSDGETCWNANNQVMLNGDSLLGNSSLSGSPGNIGSTTQGVCIVPFINQPGMYYLFSLCGPTCWAPPGTPAYLYYSVIDMSLDGGLGGIVPGQKNIPLGGSIPLSESMIAIPGDNCDVWLMVHDYINPIFRAFHITRQGLDPNPVVSTSGIQIQGISILGAYLMGSMAVTSDRRTIGITSSLSNLLVPGLTGVALCKFDPATGSVGSSLQLEPLKRVYSLAFSPDNTKMYVFPRDTAYLNLWQYDISVFDSAAIMATKMKVGRVTGQQEIILKAYNGKIYIPQDSLYVIDQPNLPGLACSYQNSGFMSIGRMLTNDVVYPFPPDTSSYREDTVVCTRDHNFGSLDLTAPTGYYGYTWNNGGTGPVHTVTAPGTYWVLCKDSCHSLIDTFIVTTKDVPLFLGTDTTLCSRTALQLDATVPSGSYLWQDNSTGSTFSTSDSGTYWVQVIAQGCTVSDTITVKSEDLAQDLGADIILCKGDKIQPVTLQANVPIGAAAAWSTGSQAITITVADTGSYWVTVASDHCTGTDTVRIIPEVCECFVQLPTAFSPNGDGLNDIFLPVIEVNCPASNYVLNIYNRFGQRVYSGHNSGKGWDGMHNGSPADMGTYMCELTFTGGTKRVKHYRKGDFILIR